MYVLTAVVVGIFGYTYAHNSEGGTILTHTVINRHRIAANMAGDGHHHDAHAHAHGSVFKQMATPLLGMYIFMYLCATLITSVFTLFDL
jgi:hypothetical protein